MRGAFQRGFFLHFFVVIFTEFFLARGEEILPRKDFPYSTIINMLKANPKHRRGVI